MKTTDSQEQAKALLKKYRAGNCSPAEERQVLNWYYSFNTADESIPEKTHVKIAQRVRKNVLGVVQATNTTESAIIRFVKTWGGMAAILAVGVSIAMLFYQQHLKPSVPDLSYKQVSTSPGERKLVILSDGSRVWLNNASTLRYPEVFADSDRTVHLQGEAFFEVSKRKHKAFIIHTPQLKVEVLGTSFDVKAFQNEAHETVTVATGKVAVSLPGTRQQLTLRKGDRALYDKQDQQLSKTSADVAESRNWQNNILAFKYESMENISRELERWYGVKFVFRNKALLHKRYTLKQKDESLNNVMKILSADEFNYSISKGTVTVW